MADSPDIPKRVDALLARALAERASDVHIEPTAAGGEARFRVDGLLRTECTLPAEATAAIVARLMVLANLLTYRRDVPQEGAAKVKLGERPVELRISIMPTTHGLRAAVRLPADLSPSQSLDTLGLDDATLDLIHSFIRTDGGVLAIVGPAGSGKTTTAYAVLEAIAAHSPGLSIVSLEDPVERDLPAVTQIQVRPFGELSYAVALRSMLRQDPQVLMLGEVRDPETAGIAMQAGLSGHRLVCTLHAADAAQAVSRLLEMGLEPYQISGSLFGVISQRLLRKKAPDGYSGRVPISEAVTLDDAMRRQITNRATADDIRQTYQSRDGFVSLRQSAERAKASGLTDAAEVSRVLGLVPSPGTPGEG
jgi:type II secretory ATPase GspE/PulE/Tfp pilus assembly ATPase PilB-like protein